MAKLLSTRDYVQIREAAQILGVSEGTLRNWDRAGKLRAHRHPINGYRLYRASDLHAVLREFPTAGIEEHPTGGQLTLELVTAETSISSSRETAEPALPPSHWSAEVALDPKHRPQRWDAPSSTVRRDWRKYPQEAHVLDARGQAYRRFSPEEIAILQGFRPEVVRVDNLSNRELIASVGDAVPPPLARAVMSAVDEVWDWRSRTAVEVCAGIGGLAEGAASIGLEHEVLIDISAACGALLVNDRPWRAEAVKIADVTEFDYAQFRSRIGLLSGGPPCQPWSQSGHRRGQADERDLLGHLDSIVRQLEPEVFVFENVPGLTTAANEPYLRHVVENLRAPGPGLAYGVMVGMLNAGDFGVPQVRRRIFILGFRDKPASFGGQCFARIERSATHSDPSLPRRGRQPWVTVGDALQGRPDPGGWRRWIAAA
jgi:excisionase family DNA binding protein